LEHQRAPALESDPANQPEALAAIGGLNPAFLIELQAGEHHAASGLTHSAKLPRHPDQRPRQDIRQDQPIGCMRPYRRRTRPRGTARRDPCAVQPGIVARHPHGLRIDIARHDPCMARQGGGDCQHPGSAPDIENAPRSLRLENGVERDQAAERRPMMAGAERRAGIDLDGDAGRRMAAAIMAAME